MIPGIISAIAGAANVLTRVEISSEAGLYTNGNATTLTITAGALGVPDQDRWLAVAAASRGGSFSTRTLVAFTIDGVTYDFHDKRDGIELPCVIGLWHKPLGTTGDIVVQWSGNCDGVAMQAYRFLSSASDPRFVAALSASGADPTGTLNVAGGGAVIACGSFNAASDPTWVGLTETQAVEIDSGDWAATAASGVLTAETGRTITATAGGSAGSLLAISVKPN